MNTRAGRTVQNLSGEMAYYSFYPQALPPQPDVEIDNEMRQLLIDAHKKLALLEGISDRIPNKDLFISMYVRKEALVSSQIEGTQCTLEDVLNPEIDESVNADVSDVVNYVRAINFAVKRMADLPLCNRLIRETHAVLMNSVRGGEKTPGEFRVSQNWIGGTGSTLRNARYIPPNPQDMRECMSELERFMNADDDMDPLIKAALLHYQFETIHPFLDGNGRVGRLLITLYLMGQGEISSPVLYLSCYLKMNRIEYYDRMSEIRKSGNYEQWIKFFLRGVSETAADATETIDRLVALHQKNVDKLADVPTRSRQNILGLLAYIERNPIIETVKTAAALGLSRNGTANYIATLCSKDILRFSAKSGKARVFAYEDYLEILRKDT
ncbi:Fic family protein [Selenomonas sp. AE3005]|uniref:Fic family protein n=1 Tax=Selenomonas sp. AE3005 TaxID=1485543 RepID=UPI0025D09B7F|nr:Fic family protein [Selenomonas sp. AE3005]